MVVDAAAYNACTKSLNNEIKELEGKPKDNLKDAVHIKVLESQKILTDLIAGKIEPFISYDTPDQSPLVEPCDKDKGFTLEVQWKMKMDLPGSTILPMGLPHFTDWFWALWLGNYDAFMKIVSSKSKPELTKLLKRRESYLQLNAIFIPVLGAETLYSYTDEQLESIREGGKVERKYMQILRELLELGADINERDILGCTPLYYCISSEYTNDVTFSIGEYLLQQGADPNVFNRIGQSPLMRSLTEENLEILELLLRYKADPFLKWEILKDKRPCAYDICIKKPKAMQVMQQGVRYVNQQARRSAKERGEFKACHKCKKHAEKRCTGCFLTWYCTRDCQVADWNTHAQECKEIRADYKEVNLFQAKEANAVVYMPDGCANELGFVFNPKVSQFVVEIQLPVEQADSEWLLCIDKEEDVVYMISLQSIIGAKLRQAIQDYNRSGNRKGYFYSIVENGRHYINPTILPPETWSKFRQYAFCQHGGLAY